MSVCSSAWPTCSSRWLANFSAKSAAKKAELEQYGVLALAQITGLSETGTRINEQPLVKLDLHISGPGLCRSTARTG